MERFESEDIKNKIEELYKKEQEEEAWKEEEPIISNLIEPIIEDLKKRQYEFRDAFSLGSSGIICKVLDKSLAGYWITLYFGDIFGFCYILLLFSRCARS